MLENFHLTDPQWLLALIPLLLVFWLIRQRGDAADSGWSKVIDPGLLAVLLQNKSAKKGHGFSTLLLLGWLIGVLALANPVWQKKPTPVFQTATARVIVLDLSASMLIADVKPSRLARARFKIEDILARGEEGQTGLVAFAGDAFTVSPLTRDADTISALLQSLSPDTMPVQGSRADRGLLMALDLMKQAGIPEGQIILLADGAKLSDALLAAKQIRKAGYQLAVMSVGTSLGGPLPGLRDKQNKPIVVPAQQAELQEIAQVAGGRFSLLSNDSSDIDYLLAATSKGQIQQNQQSEDMQSQDWQAEGPWLVLLLLPLAALAFRRGWLLAVLLLVTLGQPQTVMASVWDNFWQRQDQQADQALQAGQYDEARQLAKDPMRRGSAAYRQGDYEQALQEFSQAQGADADYNKGNALAQLGKYEEAVQAYAQALEQDPEMIDARNNMQLVEALIPDPEGDKKMDQPKPEEQDSEQQSSPENEQQDEGEQQQAAEHSQQGEEQSSQESPDSQEQMLQPSADGKEEMQQPSAEGEQQTADQNSDDKQEEGDENQRNQFAEANQQEQGDEKQADEEVVGDQQQQQNNGPDNNDEDAEKPLTYSKDQQTTEEVDDGDGDGEKDVMALVEADELSTEEKLAAEQWLRRIPDDPGGLLKRKFRHQYQLRDGPKDQRELPW